MSVASEPVRDGDPAWWRQEDRSEAPAWMQMISDAADIMRGDSPKAVAELAAAAEDGAAIGLVCDVLAVLDVAHARVGESTRSDRVGVCYLGFLVSGALVFVLDPAGGGPQGPRNMDEARVVIAGLRQEIAEMCAATGGE